jgi:DNA replication protein DnaC
MQSAEGEGMMESVATGWVWQSPPPLSDADLQAAEQAAREQAAAREAEEARAYTEKHLSAPAWFILDRWRAVSGSRAEISGGVADVRTAISALVSGRSGIIIGPTNTGKSHLACAIARATGKRAMRLKDFDFAPLCEINKYRRSDEYQALLDEAKKCELLILDDFGKNECQRGDGPTYYGNIILGIIDARAEAHRQTIATTRYCNGGLLEQRMSEDLLRRIKQVEGETKTHVLIFLGGTEK